MIGAAWLSVGQEGVSSSTARLHFLRGADPVHWERSDMPGFDGLRVLSLESRRSEELAKLITSNGGVAIDRPTCCSTFRFSLFRRR